MEEHADEFEEVDSDEEEEEDDSDVEWVEEVIDDDDSAYYSTDGDNEIEVEGESGEFYYEEILST